jgi:D-apiose dehydrogenase
VTGFPVFRNQPFLRELDQFILTDIGSHVLDTARFLFGEMTSLYCQTRRVHADIRGEDVATVVMRSASGATVTCNMAYAENALEHDRFRLRVRPRRRLGYGGAGHHERRHRRRCRGL